MIDLKTHKALWEDIADVLLSRSRRHERDGDEPCAPSRSTCTCLMPQASILRPGIMAAPRSTRRSQASILRPCFWTMVRSLTAMPLGFFTPLSHFSTVDSLVLR
jgi:hypothetical protein